MATATAIRIPYVCRLEASIASPMFPSIGTAKGTIATCTITYATKNGTSTEESLPKGTSSKIPILPTILVPTKSRPTWIILPTSLLRTSHVPTTLATIVKCGTCIAPIPSIAAAILPFSKTWRATLQANTMSGSKFLRPCAIDELQETSDTRPWILASPLSRKTFFSPL